MKVGTRLGVSLCCLTVIKKPFSSLLRTRFTHSFWFVFLFCEKNVLQELYTDLGILLHLPPNFSIRMVEQN